MNFIFLFLLIIISTTSYLIPKSKYVRFLFLKSNTFDDTSNLHQQQYHKIKNNKHNELDKLNNIIDEQLYDFSEVDVGQDLDNYNYDRDGDGYGSYYDNDENNINIDNLDNDEELFDIEGNPIRKQKLNKNDHEWMFFDVAKIHVEGGYGGLGCMAMRREAHVALGGPCGGNGGHGGDVYLECDRGLNTLSMLRRRVHHKALKGSNGLGKSMHGRRGKHCIIPVPPGTIVRDENGIFAGELNTHGSRLLVAKGGRGGRGNEHFKTSRNKAPAFAEKGEPGDERWLNIELKLIADVGLIGIPNAGKSTLLAASTNAKPKIANYPFTTVIPNLGVCDIDNNYSGNKNNAASADSDDSLVLADIPGLLEGAHDGRGLGISFLRHIQRCTVLLHVISGDSIDPVGDFKAINQELELYNPTLMNKTQVVVINKIDIPEVNEKLPELLTNIKKECGHTRVLGISAVTTERVKELMQRVRKLVKSIPKQSLDELMLAEEERVSFERSESSRFTIITDPRFPGQFRVEGNKIERIVNQMNWDYYEAAERFQRILQSEGITDALRKAGATNGDLVMIGEWDFSYTPGKTRWMADLGLEDIVPTHSRPAAFTDDE